jgi:threonine dehydratase
MDVRLKMESVQLGGSFKIRGMVNAFHCTPKDQRAKVRATVSMTSLGQLAVEHAAATGEPLLIVASCNTHSRQQ